MAKNIAKGKSKWPSLIDIQIYFAFQFPNPIAACQDDIKIIRINPLALVSSTRRVGGGPKAAIPGGVGVHPVFGKPELSTL